MDPKFPKKVKNYKVGDKVICVDNKHTGWYMVKGVVRHVGKTLKSGNKEKVGVEFEKNILKKIKTSFKVKPGHGAHLDPHQLMKYKRDFDLASFKAFYEGKSPVKKLPKQQTTVELATDQEEDNETDGMLTSRTNMTDKTEKQSKKKSEEIIPQKEEEKPKEEPKKEEPKQQQQVDIAPPIPEKNDYIDIHKNSTNEDIQKLVSELTKAKDERKKAYMELQKVQMSNTSLLMMNQRFEKDYKDAQRKTELIQQDYDELKQSIEGAKDGQQVVINNDEALEKQKKEIQELKLKNGSQQDDIDRLQKKLEQYSDYDEFKKKFEKSSIDLISINEENKIMKKQLEFQKQEISELKERCEIYELEGEVVARNEDIPTEPEQLKKNYNLLLMAFEKIDLDIEIQKEEYEDRIMQLNEKIADLNKKQTNILASEEVKRLIEKKDKELQELYTLIDQYSKSNRMIERLSEQMQIKEEEMNKFKREMDSGAKRVLYLEEENKLLDEIMIELEETLEVEIKKNEEQIKENNMLKQDKDKLNEQLSKFKQKLEELTAEKVDLEFQTSQLDEDKQQIQSMAFQQNKVAISQHQKIREKMITEMHAQESYWESIKWRIYFESIPQDMALNLKTENFDKIKNLFLLNDRIDIILENLSLHYLFDEICKSENLNLYGTARDVFYECLHFQNYLNVLREQFLQLKSIKELEDLQKTDLYDEIYKNIPVINNIYEQLKEDNFSPHIVFSSLSEANIKLKDQIILTEHQDNHNVYFKFLLNTWWQKLMDQHIKNLAEGDDKKCIEQVIPNIIYVSECIFEIQVEKKEVDKLQNCLEKFPDSIREFKMWFDSIYKKIDERLLTPEEMKKKVSEGFWIDEIKTLNEDLDQFKILKETVKKQDEDINKIKENMNTKIKELESQKDQKNKLDAKIMRLQSKVNNIATLELEISELKKIERSQQKQIDKLQSQQQDIKKQSTSKVDTGDQNIMTRLSLMQNKLKTNSNFMNMVQNNPKSSKTQVTQVSDYKPRVKFEINSLNALLTQVLQELKNYKKKMFMLDLKQFKESTPNFQTIIKNKFDYQFAAPSIQSSIKYLKNSEYLMKKEVGNLKVIDNKNLNNSIKHYNLIQTQIYSHKLNSRNILNASLKKDINHLNVGYDINFKSELDKTRQKDLQSIYGKLKLLNGTGDKNVKGNKLNLQVNLI